MRNFILPIIAISYLAPLAISGQSGQVPIPRVNLMPDQPAPYNMRDWKEVALQYDSFLYDITKTGTHLPLCFLNPSGINYPQMQTFRLHTYVGTNSPFGNEAINVLPSLVGASPASDRSVRKWFAGQATRTGR